MAFRSSVFLYWAFLFGVWSLLLFEAVGPRVTVSAPMCLDHQGHWLRRRIMRIALIIAGIWLFFAAVTLRSWFGMDPSMNHLGTVFSYCYVGLMPCFAIFVGVLEAWMIGPGDMGPRGVTMRNVHPAFRDAVDHAN